MRELEVGKRYRITKPADLSSGPEWVEGMDYLDGKVFKCLRVDHKGYGVVDDQGWLVGADWCEEVTEEEEDVHDLCGGSGMEFEFTADELLGLDDRALGHLFRCYLETDA